MALKTGVLEDPVSPKGIDYHNYTLPVLSTGDINGVDVYHEHHNQGITECLQ